ncbi:hypothetical protein OSB04_005996 [Centaurea solstitialis]|uniref:Uncharacterized protein n=1 Tax=Centaurea solstitialis TaxID=347529 RepID=A0AA38TUX3_9ASTR|nr:hypothetical protein OSB04_005996 [Centaurea solstitialis]
MAKQNIIVKVAMFDAKKTRKAMKIAVGVSGVESAALIGSNKNQIKVTGEGIDSVELAMLLRKGVGCTELVSVVPWRRRNRLPPLLPPVNRQLRWCRCKFILSIVIAAMEGRTTMSMKLPATKIPLAPSCKFASSDESV